MISVMTATGHRIERAGGSAQPANRMQKPRLQIRHGPAGYHELALAVLERDLQSELLLVTYLARHGDADPPVFQRLHGLTSTSTPASAAAFSNPGFPK